MRTVKDGQLCWAIIAMGTPPPCELWEAWSGTKRPPAWAGFAQVGVIIVMRAAMLLTAGGSVFTTPLRSSHRGVVPAINQPESRANG